MNISQALESLRSTFPGCSLVAFGDLTTRVVLRSSHDGSYRREHLDELCSQAAGCFAVMDHAVQTGNPRADGAAWPAEAIVLTSRGANGFVRAGQSGADFLGFACDTSVMAGEIAREAAKTLTAITDGPDDVA
jgi:hypothetical protein